MLHSPGGFVSIDVSKMRVTLLENVVLLISNGDFDIDRIESKSIDTVNVPDPKLIPFDELAFDRISRTPALLKHKLSTCIRIQSIFLSTFDSMLSVVVVGFFVK